MRALFVADQFADAPRTKGASHPGGAELTDHAAILACPGEIETATFDEMHDLDRFDVVVVGNSGSASAKQLNQLAETQKCVLFEHDVRICHFRGNFPVVAEPIHRFQQRCTCPHRAQQALWKSALGAIFLTHRQLAVYNKNPWFQCDNAIVLGSSLFESAFFDRVDSGERKSDRTGTWVSGSKHKIKGADPAYKYAESNGWNPERITGMTPTEVLETLATAERFVYLPIGLEPAGRMPVEARFLGCEVVVNPHVGVTGESWWHLNDEMALNVLRDAPDRFWRIVSHLVERTSNGVEQFG